MPNRWIAKSSHDDDHGDRHDVPARDGWTSLIPSTAESTEIAGVIMLSPKNSEAPKIPSAARIADAAGATERRAAGDQGDQRQDPALAVVVGAQHQHDVLDA